jgi:Polyketide cyclase / dehydrase and lipid transport
MLFQSVSRSAGAAALIFASVMGGIGAFLIGGTGSAVGKDGKREPTAAANQVAVTRQVVIERPPSVVFAFVTAEDVLPKVLTDYGPLPAVVRTSKNTGAWDTPGSARIVHLADGNTVREQLTAYSVPGSFKYRVWDFSDKIIQSLATEATGVWTFAPHRKGTLVTWTYTFSATNAAAAIPLSLIAKLFWRGYMDVCLENTTRLLTSKISSQSTK